MTWLGAAVLAGCAVELWRPGDRRLLATRFGVATGALRIPAVPRWVAAVPVFVVAAVVLHGPALVVAIAALSAVAVLVETVRRARSRTRATGRRRAVVEALSFLASELRAGAVPEIALVSVAKEASMLASAARAAGQGVDVVPVLRQEAATPGHEALGALASAWRVADRSGAPMADVLARLVDRVRDDLDLDREVEAELSPARATARIMALLPLVGLGLGAGIGGDPVGVVVGTWVGAFCAAAGIALAVVGVVWIERVAATVPR